MDLTKKKKSDLTAMCKERKLKDYSKLKKEELIELLVKDGVKHVVEEKPKKEKEESEKKPRFEGLEKKLASYIDLSKYKEEILKLDVNAPDKEFVNLFKDEYADFLESREEEDYKRYVDKYGGVKAIVEYLTLPKHEKISKLSVEELYKVLALYVFGKDTAVYSVLLKKARKVITDAEKAEKKEKEKKEKEAKAKSSPKKPVKKTTEEEPESQSEAETPDNLDDDDEDF